MTTDPTPLPPIPDLTPTQLRVMDDMFLTGLGFRAACEKYNISMDTLGRWQRLPAWKLEWETRIREQQGRFRSIIGTATGLAAKTYISCMQDATAPWKDRLHAADSVAKLADFEPARKIEHSGTIATTTDLETVRRERQALEARLAAAEANDGASE